MRLLPVLLLPALFLCANARAADCFVECKADFPCETQAEAPAQPVVLAAHGVREIEHCEKHVVKRGQISGFYVHNKLAKFFTLGPGETAAARFQREPAECGLSSTRCRGEWDKDIAVVKGRDFDAGRQARLGGPCSLGLPCGVVMRPDSDWSFRLEDATINGEWEVTGIRVASGVTRVQVVNGVVRFPAAALLPGAAYQYRLLGPDRKPVAAGEFSTVSRRTADDIRAYVATAKQTPGVPEGLSVLNALMTSNLVWDAYQHLSAGRKQP